MNLCVVCDGFLSGDQNQFCSSACRDLWELFA